jgi:hypothetical protein
MNGSFSFTPRFLSAPEYVFALHGPSDHAAVLVRNRTRHQTTQRILAAETIASAPFQSWLHQQNESGADIFIGMNPVREGSRSRTKEQIREVRHTYLDLDEEAGASLQAIRTSGDVPPPNFVLDTSPGKHQVVWRVEGFDTNQAETLLRALASQYGGDPAATDISRLLRLPGFANQRRIRCARAPRDRGDLSRTRLPRSGRFSGISAPHWRFTNLIAKNSCRPSQPVGSRLGLRQTGTGTRR